MITTKKANHQANIVRVAEIKPHTNADTLQIIPIGEYQVVSKKGQFHVGDLAVYIQLQRYWKKGITCLAADTV